MYVCTYSGRGQRRTIEHACGGRVVTVQYVGQRHGRRSKPLVGNGLQADD